MSELRDTVLREYDRLKTLIDQGSIVNAFIDDVYYDDMGNIVIHESVKETAGSPYEALVAVMPTFSPEESEEEEFSVRDVVLGVYEELKSRIDNGEIEDAYVVNVRKEDEEVVVGVALKYPKPTLAIALFGVDTLKESSNTQSEQS